MENPDKSEEEGKNIPPRDNGKSEEDNKNEFTNDISADEKKNGSPNVSKNKVIVTRKSFFTNVLTSTRGGNNEVDAELVDSVREKKSVLKDLSPNESLSRGRIRKKNSNLKNLDHLDGLHNFGRPNSPGDMELKESSIEKKATDRQGNSLSDVDVVSETNNSINAYTDKGTENNNQNDMSNENSSIHWSTSNLNTDSNSDFSNVEVKILSAKEEDDTKMVEDNFGSTSCKKKKKSGANEYGKLLSNVKDKKLKEKNINDNVGKEKKGNFFSNAMRSVSLLKNVEDDHLANVKMGKNRDNKTFMMYGIKRESTYDNSTKRISILKNYAGVNRNKNASSHSNAFFYSSSKSCGHIKLSSGNIKVKNDRNNLGANKNMRNAFENFFCEIWKRNMTIKKEFCTSNSKNGLSPFKSNFTDNYLNQSNDNELMTQIPLKFKDETIETLYVLNLNNWISSRMIIIGMIMLILCFFIWLLFSWSFKSSAWEKDSYIVMLFHLLMILNTIILLFFIIVGLTELSKYAEVISYVLFGIMVGIWGLWNIATSLTLNDNLTSKVIPSLSSAVETIYALTYIYGLLPLVIMDVFFPSRTKYNWFMHLLFIVLNSTSIILVGARNPEFVPSVFVVFRVIAYTTLCLFLYIGCYTSELQIRYVFYNLLITGYKLDKVESAMNKNNSRNNKKISTAIEDLVLMIKECTKVILELENETDINFNVHSKTSYCTNILEQCLSTLTKTDNLYNVDYDVFDKFENKKFIEAYVSKSKSNFFGDQDEGVDFKLNKSFSTNDFICVDKVDIDKKEIKKFLKEIDIPHVTNMIQLIDNKSLSEWDFNCLNYFENSKYPFFDINLSLMFTIEHDIPMNSIINFLSFVEKQYNNVPYHNTIHATMVTQKFFCLSKKLGIYDHMEYKIKLVMFISGICHDVGHPGYNNLFFVNSLHPLSIIYNDISVLENYHASITFKILQLNQCNLLKSFSEKDFRLIRSYIIELILSTDMKYHFEIISKFRIRRENEDFDYVKNNDDLLVLIKMIIKSADISHGSVKWNEHYKWCQRVLCEFYSQGDEELKNKMPLSPLCDRTKHNEVCQSQITFLKFVVMPLFEELTYIDDIKFVKNFCLKRLHSNCLMWEKLMKEEKAIKVYDPTSVKRKEKNKKKIDKRKKSYIDLTLFFIKNISE
ncbi:3',5'-cyclic nucleotide phosphodiesterase, putative [Plasmodium vivax]|uniref:Phosphodiesterase n=5 Tax=Plasmodium vivax TaxID=5855 RepID=A5JZK2_PLAVS|nr:3',5'-cyclic-nucleotide phosphodiesterase, putative [Plasmodium vivax]KMZ84301.1 3',5'-cyclic-nucleotide phosphodiesterase [Plasmodium vivax Brazil I]KMZ90081.1 3',5'-cyclic-nucleotide phosphodiesterase [Plasmodium vivax Mauritania I]KMZ97189.1 3',5'-cyclic-nucleotide phosphodiesterase [Plasmodium vivax North Korean]EDL47413.1 3',5'-cyclic-nucleotide phosphodiesterase, putative [Plasmodium vivax]CAI7723381.1 3',5'-cyclic nucleotide phosphodiesterase beta, putative [Plasmodium vivax]|eukprot:XP_001617140.1 3',5'-cyclic-nucleotide phosphodiesterase [Plasmodium vivax Sal-1]